jgi:signal transduction histidine kinase/CheY-like chemotaxis protein
VESHLGQQCLFSGVATTGVAAMHFTGMRAATFWSSAPPSEDRGYPPALATAIVSIAITTCIAANGLLAHTATVARNKLAEIVWTRRKLWRTIAQKENAEAAAAARSEFIASASHEIRTPLHHLQGYSDLLSQTELTEEGRLLLLAIQRATKTLSLITNNVLDWSKLEQDAETSCRPVALDIRTVCESILVLLPNKDDEAEVELMVVVKPDVPHSIFLDETYIHRILMNLISNALKFTTRAGYILLLIEIEQGKLVATVKDTGSGIPPSFLPHLFEPFKQAQTRGSQRGTGLGLSIVKQLLHKMDGSIRVESEHVEAGEIEPHRSGSTFIISIPVQVNAANHDTVVHVLPKIAIFHGGNERAVEGLQIAWEKFGFDPVLVKDFDDLSGTEWKYIWTDLPFLKKNPACLHGLLGLETFVLVPYDARNTFHQVPEILSAPNFIPLPRPLIWHSIAQRIIKASQEPRKSETPRIVRFASTVEIVAGDKDQAQESTAKKCVILLVEDNPINQKLGKKMLESLGYEVLIADNGQEAIDLVTKDDANIDAILMDQSMPQKDGVTATREIRELEATRAISRRIPIVALTAVVSSTSQMLFKAAGADDFLAKPLSLVKLEQTLAAHLPSKWK